MPKIHNILVTRQISDEYLSLAETCGLHVETEPAIRIEFRNDWFEVQSVLRQTEDVVFAFSSANGVRGFERFRKAGVGFPEHVPVYAVGEKTAEELEKFGIKARVPGQQDGTGLARIIREDFEQNAALKKSEVLHFCGNRRRDEFRHFLNESKIAVKDIVVYGTVLNKMNLPEGKEFDAVLFYSPSAVQAFRSAGGFRMGKLPELFAIGHTTARELSIESGRHVHISPEPDTDEFLRFVARVLGEVNQKPAKGDMDKNF